MKELTKEEKISIAVKKRWAEDKNYREVMRQKWAGKKHTPETIEKMRLAQIKRWEKIRADPSKYQNMIDKMIKNHARPTLGKTGVLSPGWKGGRYSSKRDGYVYVSAPGHPNARHGGKGGGGYVLEHRLVMEKAIGRYLEADEDINHINGIKDDNRLENLMLVRHNAHYKMNVCPKCSFKWGIR